MASNTKRLMQGARGTSLIEVMVSLTLLGIASLGLVGGLIISSKTNALSGRRTYMKVLAQSRVERLLATRSDLIPTGTPGYPTYLAAMAPTGSDGGTTAFDPNAAIGTGGWVLDNLETQIGTDAMAGPVLIDRTTMTSADNMMSRTADLNSRVTSCADALIVNDPFALCREIHVETAQPQGATGPTVLHVWVRVVRGGVSPSLGLVLTQDIAL